MRSDAWLFASAVRNCIFIVFLCQMKMNMPQIGKILIIAGTILVIAGLILFFAGDRLSWLGRLPGDIRVEKENFRFYFPITTMIILSILLTVIVWIIRKIF